MLYTNNMLLRAVRICSLLAVPSLWAQGTLADYQRAEGLRAKARGLVVNSPGGINWIGDSDHFWYPRAVKGGTEFVLVDAERQTRKPAFDQQRMAVAISVVTGHKYTALELPFAPHEPDRTGNRPPPFSTAPLTFADKETAIQFGVDGWLYKCSLTGYTCSKLGPIPREETRDESSPVDVTQLSPRESGGDPVDGLEYQAPGSQDGDEGEWGGAPHGCAPKHHEEQAQTREGAHERPDVGSQIGGQVPPEKPEVCASFDGKWEAFIENFNVYLKPAGDHPAFALSFDGSDGNYYTLRTIAWSPDSKKLVAYHTRPGYNREVMYIESSPHDQIQPKHMTIHYLKPGDTVDIAYPVLFDLAARKGIEIENSLFPNPYSLSPPAWWKDSRGFTFEYNQRGHQVYRVIEVDAQTGKARPLISEASETFIYYNKLGPGLTGGRRYRHDVDDGKEIIWGSERAGWEHLYLYDGATGEVKNQITKGEWLVRNVDWVDDKRRQVWFDAGGSVPGEDPYFAQAYRINFDGTGLTRVTSASGTHSINFSHDHQYFVDTWQRVDLPPIAQLHRTADLKTIMDLDHGDASAWLAADFHYPEVFVAKGRDGTTDIWGIIIKPTNFDSSKQYPVIENIYAGPHGSFVPKGFIAYSPDQSLADLGFVVVHIDGMGTSNRSKRFHDVCYKNLADAGFADRILWHKAAAAKYPWYDISRVGIFGTSAGGQSSLGGLLFHPDFYKVIVTNSGCHDNRVDKLWWNEQWMGWPVGPHYAASSNVDNAYRLQGKVLIIDGELDTNVDPASSLQVVNALIKAHKHFEMLYIPGQNHGVPILSAEHYRDDFFVHNLLGVEPPDWNNVAAPEEHEVSSSEAGH
jgi:dipeptidyl aminopeptidase/acylaminoacyl peptidase